METNLSQQQETNVTESAETISRKAFSWTSLGLLLIGAGIIIGFDQFTKNLVVEHIPFLHTWLPENIEHLSPWFRIVHWHNSGAAFGLFQNGNPIFLALGIAATVFIILLYPTIDRHEWALRAAMTFQLGGAFGNMIDRIRFGHVIDFISILRLPVFNIADASIAVGVGILVLDVVWTEYQERKTKDNHTPEPAQIAGEADK